MLPPFLPMLVGLVVLQVLPGGGLALPRLAGAFLTSAQLRLTHLGDLLAYNAVAVLHIVVCLAAIGTLGTWILRLPAALRSRALRLLRPMAGLLVALVLLMILLRDQVVLFRLSFRNICFLLDQADLGTGIAATCYQASGDLTLVLLAWLPTFAGMGIVVVAASLAGAAAGSDPASGASEEAWRAGFALRTRLVQRALYVLSTVLVTSTLTFVLFAYLPVGLISDEASRDAATVYARGLAAFWGVLFTLTLAASIAGPALLLFREARQRVAGQDEPGDLHDWLREQIYVSARKQLVNAAVLLAPLLAGPAGSLLEKAAG